MKRLELSVLLLMMMMMMMMREHVGLMIMMTPMTIVESVNKQPADLLVALLLVQMFARQLLPPIPIQYTTQHSIAHMYNECG
jgi:hypothetical protein